MFNEIYFSSLFSGTSEALMNRILSMDPDIEHRLALLEGKLLRIEVRRQSGFFLRVQMGQVKVLRTAAGSTDATVRIALALSREMPAKVRKTWFFDNLIGEIEGEPDVVNALKLFFSGFNPDIEEGLSQIIGDTLAHKLGHGVRTTKNWSNYAGTLIVENVLEFLREERRLLPARKQIEHYFNEVGRLESDISALESRVISLNRIRE